MLKSKHFLQKKTLDINSACQKKRLEKPVKPIFRIPKIKPSQPNITIVTSPRENLTIITTITPPKDLTSPKKVVYPPLESDEDILEIDLKISESENSESENGNEASDTAPTQKQYFSAGKSRLDPSVFNTTIRPPSKINRAPVKKLPQGIKRLQPSVWPKSDPTSKRELIIVSQTL